MSAMEVSTMLAITFKQTSHDLFSLFEGFLSGAAALAVPINCAVFKIIASNVHEKIVIEREFLMSSHGVS